MRHDRWMRMRLAEEAPRMSKDAQQRFDDILTEIRADAQRQKHKPRIFVKTLCAVAAVLVMLIILPNLSPKIAHAMEQWPLIGGFIRVVTIRQGRTEDEFHYSDVTIPQVEGEQNMQEAVDYINSDVQTLTEKVLEQYQKDISELSDAHMGLLIDYEVLTNSDAWFTMRLMVYHEAGSSIIEYHYYHIDKKTGSIASLPDLFRADYDYQTPISQNILEQMRQRMQDPSVVYWINPDSVMGVMFTEIATDQPFYFNADGDLVIAFGKYEVAPGYMGTPEFVIPRAVYQDGLADQ